MSAARDLQALLEDANYKLNTLRAQRAALDESSVPPELLVVVDEAIRAGETAVSSIERAAQGR